MDNIESCQRNSDHGIIAMYSRWIGPSQVRIKVRKIGGKTKKKIMVDIEELSPEGVEVGREKLNELAVHAACNYGGSPSKEFLVLLDYLTERRCQTLDGDTKVTNVRSKGYAFQGNGK